MGSLLLLNAMNQFNSHHWTADCHSGIHELCLIQVTYYLMEGCKAKSQCW